MRALAALSEVAGDYDALVFDQWGVLHDGANAYPGAVAAVARLAAGGARLAVLSNSGKRAALNARRIADMGFDPAHFALVMTSGEALWQDAARGALPSIRRLWPVTGKPGDAQDWAEGLDGVEIVDDPQGADAVLLMGLAEDADGAALIRDLAAPPLAALPILCSNPDRAAPRPGATVMSPGAIAHARAEAGAEVRFYGKPHRAVFDAVARGLGTRPERMLMIGDSPEHDIAGGHFAGWSTVLVRGGLHVHRLAEGDPTAATAALCREIGAPFPDFTIQGVA